ncbi:MAG TPA: methyltransferase domain-containing protein [Planctomycetes bacterium]|nr:methyltransferase domain-containing protein [Planctomycetota bacterium]
MKPRLVELLCCPACGADLTCHSFEDRPDPKGLALGGEAYGTEVVCGLLACQTCDLAFPIIEEVPRVIRNAFEEYADWFSDQAARISAIEGLGAVSQKIGSVDSSRFDKRSNESFSLQWEKYQYGDKTWFKSDLDQRRDEFLDAMQLTAEQLDGKLVLDAGCGNGRLTASVTRYGAEVVGMDLSRSVVRAQEMREEHAGENAHHLHFVQGNVMEPPFPPNTFDHEHTSGVLHHTPSTERSLDSFLTLVKPGGRVYVQLYRTREPWVGIPNAIIRAFTSRLPLKLLFGICYTLAPLHRLLVLLVAKLRGESSPIENPTRREQAVSLFDNYSPRYQYRYTPSEMQALFEKRDLKNVRDVTFDNEARHMIAFAGDK